ncbi:MAG: ribosome silencing factor [Bryobacteraceae bacterium]|nr:ribosome silencing factor [Bryobacteraceae bacterium]
MPSAAASEVDVGQLNWFTAVRAAQSKKALDFVALDLRDITSLTDFFIICTGTNTRQNQAVCDEVHVQMKNDRGELPVSVEGYDNAEWVLMDYGDFILHIFIEKTRLYYDLERLWRHAKRMEIPPEEPALA